MKEVTRGEARNASRRSIGAFIVIGIILYAVVNAPGVSGLILEPINNALASVSASLIHLFGGEVSVTKNVLALPDFAVEIVDMCNGVEATLLLCSGLLAFPAPWKHKLKGMIFGVLAIYFLNTLRVISLLYLGAFNREWFEWIHWYLWDIILIAYIAGLFLFWVRTAPPRITLNEG